MWDEFRPPRRRPLGNRPRSKIVGTHEKHPGPNNQRVSLNGTHVAQMSDTQPIDLNSDALGSDNT